MKMGARKNVRYHWVKIKDRPDHEVYEINWNIVDNPKDHGKFQAVRYKKYFIVSDGELKIAAASQKRISKFLYRGIKNRLMKLEMDYLKDHIKINKGDYCINFGAHIGEMAILLRSYGAEVLAIEPDDNVIPALTLNAREYGFNFLPFAAWNGDKYISLKVDTDRADTSVFGTSAIVIIKEGKRIDSMVPENQQVKLIVGDAEGAEPEVLEGAIDTLKRTEYVSLRASAERQGEQTLQQCEEILRNAGFEIVYREDTGFCILIGHNKAL